MKKIADKSKRNRFSDRRVSDMIGTVRIEAYQEENQCRRI